MLKSLFNKAADLKLQHRCCPVKFTKFSFEHRELLPLKALLLPGLPFLQLTFLAQINTYVLVFLSYFTVSLVNTPFGTIDTAIIRRSIQCCSAKMLLLQNLQYSQENTKIKIPV